MTFYTMKPRRVGRFWSELEVHWDAWFRANGFKHEYCGDKVNYCDFLLMSNDRAFVLPVEIKPSPKRLDDAVELMHSAIVRLEKALSQPGLVLMMDAPGWGWRGRFSNPHYSCAKGCDWVSRREFITRFGGWIVPEVPFRDILIGELAARESLPSCYRKRPVAA